MGRAFAVPLRFALRALGSRWPKGGFSPRRVPGRKIRSASCSANTLPRCPHGCPRKALQVVLQFHTKYTAVGSTHESRLLQYCSAASQGQMPKTCRSPTSRFRKPTSIRKRTWVESSSGSIERQRCRISSGVPANGGKVDTGFIELRFLGLHAGGKLAFRLIHVEIRSNETTMRRTPVRITNASTSSSGIGVLSGNRINASGTSGTGSVTITGAPGKNET